MNETTVVRAYIKLAVEVSKLKAELARKQDALREICNIGAGRTPPDGWGYAQWHDEIMNIAIRGARKPEINEEERKHDRNP